MRWAWRTGAIALWYFILGRPALLLADPPGYASPVWPAAGLAVGIVYCYRYGYMACLGIAIGSAALNWTISPGWSQTQILAPLSIALGAAGQAALARYILVRKVGPSSTIESLRTIALFCLISGPVACLLSGVWGPSMLRFFGVLAPEQWFHHMFTWWLGDSIGAAIFAPATLAMLSRRDPAWRDRWQAVVMIAALALVITFGLFYLEQARLSFYAAFSWFVVLAAIQVAALRVSAKLA